MFRVRFVVSAATVAMSAALAACSSTPSWVPDWMSVGKSTPQLVTMQFEFSPRAPMCGPGRDRPVRPPARSPCSHRARRSRSRRTASCHRQCRSAPVTQGSIRCSRALPRRSPRTRSPSCCNRPDLRRAAGRSRDRRRNRIGFRQRRRRPGSPRRSRRRRSNNSSRLQTAGIPGRSGLYPAQFPLIYRWDQPPAVMERCRETLADGQRESVRK